MPSPQHHTPLNQTHLPSSGAFAFRPLQPAVQLDVACAGMQYHELQAGAALQDVVYCYWLLHTPARSENLYRVVPDGCVDLFCDMGTQQGPWLSGASTGHWVVALAPATTYFGIRFRPGGFTHFVRGDSSQLQDRQVALQDIDAAWAAQLAEACFAKHANQPDYAALEATLLHRRMQGADMHARIAHAVALLVGSQGNLAMPALADAVCWSPRQLRRAFAEVVGISPKTFAGVVRFQAVLHHLRAGTLDAQTALALGYYDQAHLAHAVKQLYGSGLQNLR